MDIFIEPYSKRTHSKEKLDKVTTSTGFFSFFKKKISSCLSEVDTEVNASSETGELGAQALEGMGGVGDKFHGTIKGWNNY